MRHSALVVLLLQFLTFGSVCCAGADQIDLLIAEIESARKGLASVRYAVKYSNEFHSAPDAQGPLQTGVRRTSGTVRDVRKGLFRHYEENGESLLHDGTTQTRAIRKVVNATERVFWHPDNPIAYAWDHTAPDRPSPASAAVFDSYESAGDILLYAFGVGTADFPILRSKPNNLWHVRQEHASDGDYHIVEMLRGEGADSRRLVAAFEVRPAFGFMVTRASVYDASGKVSRSFEVTPGRAGDVWYPKEIRETLARVRTSSFKVTSFEANPAVADGEFEFSVCRPPEGLSVIRRKADGTAISSVVRDGKIVPRNIAEGE